MSGTPSAGSASSFASKTGSTASPPCVLLESPDLAQVVVNSLFHFAGERYTLFAFVVMPSHFHWLFQPLPGWVPSLARRFQPVPARADHLQHQPLHGHRVQPSAEPSKAASGSTESYDHWVRDEDELERIIGYIEANPVKAGLAEAPDRWRFSSAWHRTQTGTEWGLPLAPLA